MPSDNHYLPFSHRDWLSSRTVVQMDCAARGVYITLLAHQWEDGSLPPEPRLLQRLAMADLKEWRAFEEWLDDCFPVCADGQRRNPRMECERSRVLTKREKLRENASKGGIAKKQNEATRKQKPSKAVANANDKAVANDQQTSAIPESESELTEPVGSGAPPPVAPKTNDVWAEVESTLVMLADELGQPPPIAKDCRPHLKAESGLRLMVAEYGQNRAVEIAVFAWRAWQGACSWEAVHRRRYDLVKQMEAPKLVVTGGGGSPAMTPRNAAAAAAEALGMGRDD